MTWREALWKIETLCACVCGEGQVRRDQDAHEVEILRLDTFTFSRPFNPKRLTYVRLTMYTHFTFTLMAHCTSGAIRGSVSCSRTLRQGIELATFCLLNDFFTSCTTVAPLLPVTPLLLQPFFKPCNTLKFHLSSDLW